MNPVKSIAEFYAGQSILLTGATGFLGKVFIEKVLRSCPDVCEIFLLMRPKKNLNVDERLEKILNIPLFDKLREERSVSFKKLIPVSGNIAEKELGLSAVDRQVLVERVTVVIHAAASVRFNESLKYAIYINVRSTKDVCTLAQSMKNLIALVYVSTAFTNIDNAVIEEKIYSPEVDWRNMIEIAESFDEYTLNIFAAKCLKNSPNTYIFTKKLAESVIQEYSSSLPCAIVRPSMVISSFNDPIPGWIDNIYGPIGLLMSAGKGVLRVLHHSNHTTLDVVPVDFVIKTILAVPWKLGLSTFTPGTASFVLNCTNSNLKNISMKEFGKIAKNIAFEIPLEGMIWIPNIIFTENCTMFYILTILLHLLPALSIDLILKLFGRQPMLVKLIKKLYVANCALQYFMFNQWEFNNANNLALMHSIPFDDREIFSFDFSNLDCREYMKTNIIGVKNFLLHEDVNQLDAAKMHRKRIYLFVRLLEIIIVTGVLWMMYK